MSVMAVFVRTLLKASAIFLGATIAIVQPSLDRSTSRTSVTAHKSPRSAALDGLRAALTDDDAGVRRAAARALSAIDPASPTPDQPPPIADLTKELAAADPAARARAACALREHGEAAAAAIQPLVRLLGDGSPVDPAVCEQRWRRNLENVTTPGEQAATALVAIGTRAFEPVLGTLRSHLWIARKNSAWALGALDDRRAVAALIEALKDVDAAVREQVAWALGAIDDASAVPALIDALRDTSDKVRAQAAWALGAIDDARAVDGLIAALSDRESHVRRQAAWALGAIGDSRAVSSLLPALKDSDAGVRRQAAWAIGAIGR